MEYSRKKSKEGIAWSAIERFSIQGSQFVVSLIVARLLMPSDYGLIAMMSIFMAVSTSLIDSGMAQALIQKRGRTEADKSTALLFNVVVSVAIYAIIYMCAPLIALFYDTPELSSVARVYSIVLVINSLCVVQQALITVELDFKRQAVATLSGVVVGGVVAIYMATLGYGVWALVVQQIVSSVVMTGLMWWMSKWRPRGGFSWESFRTLSKFGSKIMLSGLLHTVYVNLYAIIIGRRFAAADLGLYNRATTISALPSSNISTIVDRALYPLLCEVQDDQERAAERMMSYLSIVCFVVFPVMAGVAVAAEPLTEVLLGDKWLAVVPLLQGVAVANMWDPVMKFMGSIIRSQGRSEDFLRAEGVKKVCGVVILFSTMPFGVVWMCWGLVLYAVADMVIVIYYARRISGVLDYLSVARRIAPLVGMTAVMSLIVWFVASGMGGVSPFVQLMVLLLTGGAAYLTMAVVLNRPEMESIKGIIKKG